jgi:hypothetical protein
VNSPNRDEEILRQVVHALLLEWTFDVEVSRGMNFVDFVTSSLAPLGITTRQRFRLFRGVVGDEEIPRPRTRPRRCSSPRLALDQHLKRYLKRDVARWLARDLSDAGVLQVSERPALSVRLTERPRS